MADPRILEELQRGGIEGLLASGLLEPTFIKKLQSYELPTNLIQSLLDNQNPKDVENFVDHHAASLSIAIPRPIQSQQKFMVDLSSDVIRKFNLAPTDYLCGRIRPLNTIFDLISSTERKTSIINLWGDAGIGKSNLVRYAGSLLDGRGGREVIYVNARGITDLNTLVYCMLAKFGKYTDLDAQSAAGVLFKEFRQSSNNHESGSVLIIDDLSDVIARSQNDDTSNFFQGLVADQSKSWMSGYFTTKSTPRKIITTNQAEVHEQLDSPELLPYVTDMNKLDALESEDAKPLIQRYMPGVSEEMMSNIFNLSRGHPFILNMLGNLWAESAAEVAKLLKKKTSDQELMTEILSASFKTLKECEQMILLSVTMFKNAVSVTRLHTVSSSNQTLEQFRDTVEALSKGTFWLDITSEPDPQGKAVDVVSTHHSVIDEFLMDQAELKAYSGFLIQIKKTKAVHYIRILMDVGNQCLREHEKAVRLLLINIEDIIEAFKIISSNGFIDELFDAAEDPIGPESKMTINVIGLFIALFQYSAKFQGKVYPLLEEMIKNPGLENAKSYVLLKLLYVQEASHNQDWQMVKTFLGEHFPRSEVKGVTWMPKDLQSFVEAVYLYEKALLYTVYAEYVQNGSDSFRKERDDLYKEAEILLEQNVKDHPSDYRPEQFLLAHISRDRALAIQKATNKLEHFRQAKEMALQGMKYTELVPIVEPALHIRLAVFYANEGNERGDSKEAYESLYKECLKHRDKAREVLTDRGVGTGILAYNNELEYAITLYNWAYSLTDTDFKLHASTAVEKLGEAEKVLERVIDEMEEVIEFYKTKTLFYKMLVGLGDIAFRKAFVRKTSEGGTADTGLKISARKSLEAYERAYAMFEKDFTALNISRKDDSLYSFKKEMAELLEHSGNKRKADEVKAKVEYVMNGK